MLSGMKALVLSFDQEQMVFAEPSTNFGLTISIKKMEVFQSAPVEPYVEPVVTINDQKLEATEKFPYLGSVMSDSATINDEINLRVARASSSFGRLKSFNF